MKPQPATRLFEFVAGYPTFRQLPDSTLPEVALLGRSNVGKSSLLNILAGRKRLARTSATPGKTTMFNLYRVDDDFVFVDVPGLGYARASHTHRKRWEREIAAYVRTRDGLALVLLLMDARHAPTSTDLELMQFLKESGRHALVVLTKTDKLSGNGRAKSRRAVEAAMADLVVEWPVVETSAHTGRGRDELLEWIDGLV